MKTVVKIHFGSFLYGTQTPASDMDIKSVHLPNPRDILLQQVLPTLVNNTKQQVREKNSTEDVDDESYSLQQYLRLLSQGQTVALDMLFAPDFAILGQPITLWDEIRANRHRLVSRKAESFVGYCMQQASKYGIKGSRVAAVRAATHMLMEAMLEFGTQAKLFVIEDRLSDLCTRQEFTSIVELGHPENLIKHLDCVGRKAPFTITVKEAHAIYSRIFREYGERALQAERSEGVDWKALSHAVRVAHQCIELFETGQMTFPRPERDHLRAIKTGSLPYQAVATEIEELLEHVKSAQNKSLLREDVDRQFIDDLVEASYAGEVVNQYY